ncbi:MAG: Histone transcription regulator 3 [Claussenomyces sp. TS43310]|nr:MAG: Histone transcription regulator 3 [Claussenomyces sp. TS43310]
MSAFTALNVEPDEFPEDDFDNTREIQIEEALKLYQIALKLHAQGPAYFEQAAAAYEALFKSDIFKYSDSITEFARLEEHPDAGYDVGLSYSLEVDLAAIGSDGSPSTLPQVLYLAYKNHGQFIVDCLKHQIRSEGIVSDGRVRPQAELALEKFSQALARDESDTELWRRAARIGALLGSERIARYCLEAAVEVDDDPTQAVVEPANLEEGFAGMQLKEHLEVLSDNVALSHPIMAPYNEKTMSSRLKHYMDPYPFLPQHPLTVTSDETSQPSSIHLTVEVSERSWHALGDALLKACLSTPSDCAGVQIHLPGMDTDMIEIDNSSQRAENDQQTSSSPSKEVNPDPCNSSTAYADEINDDGSVDESAAQIQAEQEAMSQSRKRSQSAAGIQGTPDEENATQKRSKRIRNRDTTGPEGIPLDPNAQYKDQYLECTRADSVTFEFINTILDKLEIPNYGTVQDLQDIMSSENLANCKSPQDVAVGDLRDILNDWDETKAAALQAGNNADILASSRGSSGVGLAAFLEHSKTGLQRPSTQPPMPPADGIGKFVSVINEQWLPLQDVILEYFKAVQPSYRQNFWTEAMKYTVVQLMSSIDSALFRHLQEDVHHSRKGSIDIDVLLKSEYLGQMLFELHLDLYASITNPGSRVDLITRTMEKERVARWAMFASDLAQGRVADIEDELSLRYLWAAAFFASTTEDVSRDHVLSCWSDLQNILHDANDITIKLQNNVAMPEISASAAEREVSRLTTTDFFLNLFQSEDADPFAIIETLEPVLDPIAPDGSDDPESAVPNEDGEENSTAEVSSSVPDSLRDMWKFLQGGSASLRLFLWQRLREAYQNVGYMTKVFSCHLKSIEIIVGDLTSAAYADSATDTRQHTLLTWLKTLDDLLVKALTLALNEQTAFDAIDLVHVRSTATCLAQLSRLLHGATLFEDNVTVGSRQIPRTPVYSTHGPWGALLARLREMQVRCWALSYTILKEGMAQCRELFPTRDSDLADYMAVVHYSLGLRKMCKISNKIFLKMMKVELIRLKSVERIDDFLGQVLFDLYGLRLGVGVFELADHGCPVESLDRRTAFSISEMVIGRANQMSVKDLLKAEIRPTIEKMQQIIGAARSTPQMQHNLRNYTDYLKTSINPLRMIQASKGQVFVDSLPVSSPESPLAAKGWYFLLGMMALTKFRSQKKIAPGATDDLRVAATFFRLQLQFTSERWETWYRLAQCFDAELEEEVLWTADKLNSNRSPLVQLQRSSIHCYIMAMSTAMRGADSSFETSSKLSDMYHDFGLRVYSSSREPFAMEAFYLDDFQRHFSGAQGMYKKFAHPEMSRYRAWRYAASLFTRAAVEKPNFWFNHYMLGKCLWKMFTRGDEQEVEVDVKRPTMQMVLVAFEKAIETVPKPKDTRADPMLEPHYKLMSVVHKLVQFRILPPQEAADLLQRQPFAIRKGESIEIPTLESWKGFILESIRHVRHADKATWHHRMISRVAHILFDDNNPNVDQAVEARAELKDSMFTRTMVLNVWKPEFERPGRHCVYTERYARFMIRLLGILNDKANMELFAKRIRKRQADLYHCVEVWTECCLTYCGLIRNEGQIQSRQDEIIKAHTQEEVVSVGEMLGEWLRTPGNSHPVCAFMKEADELHKLNNKLMNQKPNPVEELIGDCFATMFVDVGINLPRPTPPAPPPVAPVVEPRQRGPMSLNNLVSNMDDTSEPPAIPVAVEAPPRPRYKSASKRDILRAAEAILTKAPEALRPIANIATRPRGSDAARAVASKSRSPAAAAAPSGDNNTSVANEEESKNNNEGDKDGESSEEGSLHDSADDESDTSDVPEPEDVEPEMTFPNLAPPRKTESPGQQCNADEAPKSEG